MKREDGQIMARHRRLPALVILLSACVVGAGYLTGWGKRMSFSEIVGQSDGAMAELETAIRDGKATAGTWRAYGDLLLGRKAYGEAAEAIRRAIELSPADQELRMELGLALAGGKNREGFLDFMNGFVFSEPKLAVDLFERPECRGYLRDPAFAPLYRDAKGQAVD